MLVEIGNLTIQTHLAWWVRPAVFILLIWHHFIRNQAIPETTILTIAKAGCKSKVVA